MIALAKLFTTTLAILVFLTIFSTLAPVYARNQKRLKIHFTDKEQAWLDQHTDVNVGFVDDMPPLLIIDNNGISSGILPEFMAILSEHTGINFHIKLAVTWEEMIKEGENRKTDMIGMFTPHKYFTANFDFTSPHFKVHFYIFRRGEINSQEYKLGDLVGKRVGFLGSARIVQSFVKQHPEIKFIPLADRKSLVNDLISNQVDFIIHTSHLEYWRQQNQLISFKISGQIPELSSDVVSGIRKDWPELTSIAKKVFLATKTQQKTIINHWLGYNNTNLEPVQLTQQEKAWLREHPLIRVGFDPLWAPIEFLGEDNQPQGITIQYLQYLEKSLGLEFKYIQNQSWPEALKKLENAQLDILGAVSNNYPKRDLYHLTSPYLNLSKKIFSAEYKGYLEGADALRGKRVVVVAGSSIQHWLQRNHPEIIVDSAPDTSTALKIVASGKAFALVENHLIASYYIAKLGLTQIRVVGEVTHKHNLSIAIRKDWEILEGILQKGLESIPQNKRDAIYNDWVSIKYKTSMDLTLLWQVLAGATLILLIILFWNRRLTKEIELRRKIEFELNKAKQRAEKATVAKTEFLTNMSHEIRTPLNAIIGTNHLIHQTSLTTEQLKYMNIMSSSSEALLVIINDILDFSKVEAGMLSLDSTRFNLKNVLQKIILGLEIHAKKKALGLRMKLNPETGAGFLFSFSRFLVPTVLGGNAYSTFIRLGMHSHAGARERGSFGFYKILSP